MVAKTDKREGASFGVHVPEPRRLDAKQEDSGEPTPQFVCAKCGGPNVQYSIPAWFDFNTGDYVDCDAGASELTCWCDDCEDSVEVLDRENGVTIRGRWD